MSYVMEKLRSIYRLFAATSPGLEDITKKELEELGIKGKITNGGVEFKGDLKTIYKTNLYLRTATRILLRIGIFKAENFGELVQKIKRYPWEIYIKEDIPLRIRVTSRKSRLYHTKAIEERVIEGISKRLKFEPNLTNNEDIGETLIIRVEKDRFHISIGTSGAPLYKRGYKKFLGTAPLRENYAASLILISQWNKRSPFIDLFCGAGTICIEAALIATNTPPGLYRRFSFESWRIHSEELWKRIKEEARDNIKEPEAEIFGFDREKRAIDSAIKNAGSIGMERYISFMNLSFPDMEFKNAWIVTNPPYGKRFSKKDAEDAYSMLGRWIRKNISSFHVSILSPSERLISLTGLPLKRETTFINSGIRVGIYTGSSEGREI